MGSARMWRRCDTGLTSFVQTASSRWASHLNGPYRLASKTSEILASLPTSIMASQQSRTRCVMLSPA